jgi:hypothetical protein
MSLRHEFSSLSFLFTMISGIAAPGGRNLSPAAAVLIRPIITARR